MVEVATTRMKLYFAFFSLVASVVNVAACGDRCPPNGVLVPSPDVAASSPCGFTKATTTCSGGVTCGTDPIAPAPTTCVIKAVKDENCTASFVKTNGDDDEMTIVFRTVTDACGSGLRHTVTDSFVAGATQCVADAGVDAFSDSGSGAQLDGAAGDAADAGKD